MRLGVVLLPEHPWSEARHLWRRAEELGFAHAWTYDHIAWRTLRDSTWFGSVPTLAAAALVTSRLRLGPLVASPNFRHPVPFAREVVTLDDLSDGRLTLGVGAGGEGWDATVLGQRAWDRRERFDRFEEWVDLLDRVLRSPSTTSSGRFYSASEAPSAPGCRQRPRVPFAVAATGARGMRLAVRHATTWVTNGERSWDGPPVPAADGAAVVREQAARLDALCEAEGRDPSTLRRLVLTGPRLAAGLESVGVFEETVGRYEEAGATDLVVHWPRPAEPFAGDLGTFEAAVTAVVSRFEEG